MSKTNRTDRTGETEHQNYHQSTVKVIHYYRRECYGTQLEIVVDEGDRKVLAQLTGRTKTINGTIRELLRDLSGGRIQFQEVLAPKQP
jgi:hypothetical protein